MTWRVEIKDKEGIFDAAGEGVKKDIEDFGIKSVARVCVIQVFLIEGQISASNITRICEELLVDKIVQDFSFCPAEEAVLYPKQNQKIVEVAYNPGVMDPSEESILKGINDLGIRDALAVHTAKKYILSGRVSDKELDTIVNKALANKLIQHVVKYPIQKEKTAAKESSFRFNVVLVDILKASDRKLLDLSARGQLFLNLNEMRAIKKYFKDLGRNPTDCELETIAQTWSEHCYHKTFRGKIRYRSKENGETKTLLIDNLLKKTIIAATEKIKSPLCVSVFHDNAGVIKFSDKYHVCFKVETHNHPSALEPFGGANTGVGGVIRDILGTGLGAKPICNTDVFCFAPPDLSFNRLPPGTLHPKRIMKGVVNGVRDYGNKMGIPTVNGAILFDEGFVGNPLVYCGTVGLIPKDKVYKKVHKGDFVVVVGGRTGRDGIHGATFSSGELTHESEVISSGAVQIGNPIQEKKVLDVLLKARDQNLYSAITDCGAGGLSSAVGEMGKDLGCRVDLEKVPLKYEGLSYTEIWISESQERMVLSVPKEKIADLLKVFAEENVEATAIGEFSDTGRLELFFHGCQVCDLDMKFLHKGIPQIVKDALWQPVKTKEPKFSAPSDLTGNLLKVLSHYNVASKESIIRRYDHEVQGMSVIKPLVGLNNDGPSDASVLRPQLDSNKGLAVANGINVRFGKIDPFWMAASAIDEAIRQIVAVGGDAGKIAILDNFCWGNPDKADRLGSLVRAALGAREIAVGYGVPFISGKDSLYNEYTVNGKSLAIPGTLLISAIGIIDDVQKTVTMDFKKAGNLIYLIGKTFEEMGGSIYYDTLGYLGNSVPKIDTKKGLKIFKTIHASIQKGLIQSAHDCSEGGLGATVSEMCFAGGLGVSVSLKNISYQGVPRNDFVLFSESNSRFVVEVAKKDQKEFEKLLKGISCNFIGNIESTKTLTIYGLNNKICASAKIDALKKTWQERLRW